MKEYEKSEHEIIVSNATIEKLCRKISNAITEKKSGFISAQESSDPTTGAAQIIRANATIEAIKSTMKDLGLTVMVEKHSEAIGVAHDATGELIYVFYTHQR